MQGRHGMTECVDGTNEDENGTDGLVAADVDEPSAGSTRRASVGRWNNLLGGFLLPAATRQQDRYGHANITKR